MEYSVHRQLKAHYAGSQGATEVPLDGYRIDAVVRGQLIEIQHGSLAAIRGKLERLVQTHSVRVVKPLIARKRIIRRTEPDGPVRHRRWSPKRQDWVDLFDELVYLARLFPHPRLTLEVPRIEIEEWRYPGHGKRRWKRPQDHVVEDQTLLEIVEVRAFRTARDLCRLLPPRLPRPFDTRHLSERMGVSRHVAQRIAYCLRETGSIECIGKSGNARLYRRAG